MKDVVLTVSDFVALVNQTLEYAYGSVTITGELSNFKVSKNRWVYFDLKDEFSSVRFFGTVYALPGPLEDGMMLEVRGQPRLHPKFGFSVTVQSMRPVGEGAIKKAANLLAAKLEAEGLFAEARKRALPYPPRSVGLITSKESAAYADFVKVLAARWGGVEVQLFDVQVQGEAAVGDIVRAIEACNQLAEQPDVLVIIRGGGSADDLQAFSTEQVARAVAGSRVPTLVAIGHEIDESLAELVADRRASTPSNAAELLVPDKQTVLRQYKETQSYLQHRLAQLVASEQERLRDMLGNMQRYLEGEVRAAGVRLAQARRLIELLSPQTVLARGYAIVRHKGKLVHSGHDVAQNDIVQVQLADALLQVRIEEIR